MMTQKFLLVSENFSEALSVCDVSERFSEAEKIKLNFILTLSNHSIYGIQISIAVMYKQHSYSKI